uniref:(northern house mosquito) hypothetical protein n=1 Tax=Culex pipiens TaxID=7175 RepID=A0A8D8DDF9_CULPI
MILFQQLIAVVVQDVPMNNQVQEVDQVNGWASPAANLEVQGGRFDRPALVIQQVKQVLPMEISMVQNVVSFGTGIWSVHLLVLIREGSFELLKSRFNVFEVVPTAYGVDVGAEHWTKHRQQAVRGAVGEVGEFHALLIQCKRRHM